MPARQPRVHAPFIVASIYATLGWALRIGEYRKQRNSGAEPEMEILDEDPDRPICRNCNIAMWLVTYGPKIKKGVEVEERLYQCEACGERKTVIV
jgi:hypothetical protein